MNHLYRTDDNLIYEERIRVLTLENIKLLKELNYLIDGALDAALVVKRAQELKDKYFRTESK